MVAGAPTGSIEGTMSLAAVVLAHEQPFRIGDADIRPATRELIRNGESHVIEPRVMQLLVALHRANGAVVSKDDLSHLVWEGRIVGEDAINRVVSRLRAVAEKQAGGAFRIETITKVGYRLASANGDAEYSAISLRPAPGRKPITRRELMIGGGVLASAAAVTLGTGLIHRDNTPPEARALIDSSRDALLAGSVEQSSNAIAKLRRAVQVAPRSAEAWGLLAYVSMRLANLGPAAIRSDLRTRGLAAIKQAFQLEPKQADAMAAQIYGMQEFGNWFDNERACRAALAVHPEHAILNFALGSILLQVGRTREARPFIEKTVGLVPMSPPPRTYLVTTLWDLGLLDDAEAVLDKSYDLFPRYFGVWFTRLYYLMYNGRASEAAAMFQDVPNRPLGIPDWNYDLTGLQVNSLASGDPRQIRNTVEKWKEAAKRGTGFTENASIFAAFVGDLDESFRLLDALYFNRGFSMPDMYFAKEQGMYAGRERHTYNLFRRPVSALRRDPRFAVLTREIGLDEYWRRTNSRAMVTP